MSNRKVLVAIPCLLPGGTEYQTLNLVKALIQNGYKVTVLCYFEYDLTMTKYMKDTGADVILMSTNNVRPDNFFKTFWTLFTGFKNALKKTQANVVHIQYMAPGSLAILLFKFLRAKKVIATAHVPGHIYKRKWIPLLLANYFTDSFLCVSKSSEESFFDKEGQLFSKELMAKGRKHFTIYNCIEVQPPKILMPSPNNERLTIGIISRLSYEKGIDIMIEAMPMIAQKYPNVRLLIIGDGIEKEKLCNLAKKLNLDNTITWVGLQPKSELVNYYSQMDIVSIPSRFEGFGLTAIEAMSYGIPVIASAVDGLEEIIENNKSGILVPKENPDALADTILTLIKNKKRRNEIAKAGKKRVEATFSFESYKKKICELYEVLIEGSQ